MLTATAGRGGSLAFKAFMKEFEMQNTDLANFKVLSFQSIKGKQDLKKKADELRRIALKQVLLDTVLRHLKAIQSLKDDR